MLTFGTTTDGAGGTTSMLGAGLMAAGAGMIAELCCGAGLIFGAGAGAGAGVGAGVGGGGIFFGGAVRISPPVFGAGVPAGYGATDGAQLPLAQPGVPQPPSHSQPHDLWWPPKNRPNIPPP